VAARLFLLFCAIAWLPYGLYCLAQPDSLAAAAGVVSASHTGTIELRAMYGGLQAAVGTLCLVAALRAGLVRPALLCLAFLCSGLALARLSGAALEREVSSYTALGLGFETLSAAFSVGLLLRGRAKAAPPA
jgi:Domain of unknown function (DUF4345)